MHGLLIGTGGEHIAAEFEVRFKLPELIGTLIVAHILVRIARNYFTAFAAEDGIQRAGDKVVLRGHHGGRKEYEYDRKRNYEPCLAIFQNKLKLIHLILRRFSPC